MRAAITSTLRAAPSAGRVPAVHAFIAPAGEDVGGRTKSDQVRPRGLWVALPFHTALIVRSGVIESGAHLGGRHRQFGQAAVDGAVDRVGDRRHRRHDVDFADPLGAVGVGRVRHLDEDRLDHRHVGGDRDPIIEEAGIIEAPVLVVDVLLVERPAQPMPCATPPWIWPST